MIDLVGVYATILYATLFIISALTTYLYYMSEKIQPNFMIKATMLLLLTITLNFFSIFLMRFATIANISSIHLFKDWLLLVPRTMILISLIYFFKQTTKIKNGNSNKHCK